MTTLLEEVRALQEEGLRQANLLPKVRAAVMATSIRPARAHAWRLPVLGLAAAGAMGALALFFVLSPDPLPVFVGESAQPAAAGTVVEAPPATAVPVRFGDGTALALAPRARVQVAAVDAQGATLVLERGRLNVGVVHRPGARWLVRAGGFEVRVTGTRFDIGFDPEREALTVEMQTGSVLVRGPGIPEATPLGAGQTLRAIGRERRFDIATVVPGDGTPPAPVVAAPAHARLVAPGEAPAPSPADMAPEAPPAPAPVLRFPGSRGARAVDRTVVRSWTDLALASHYDEAFAAAEHLGFGSLCARLDSGGLVLLGDVARLAGHPDRAEEAYLTARRRFPRLDRPVFAMGLMAFEQRRRYHEAATWFETYLEAYPRGPLAREAAGRLVESWLRADEPTEARRSARVYLEKYPSGPHAALARQIAARP